MAFSKKGHLVVVEMALRDRSVVKLQHAVPGLDVEGNINQHTRFNEDRGQLTPGDTFLADLYLTDRNRYGETRWNVAEAIWQHRVERSPTVVGTIIRPENDKKKCYVTSPFFNAERIQERDYDSKHAITFPSCFKSGRGEFDSLALGNFVRLQVAYPVGRRNLSTVWAEELEWIEVERMETPRRLPARDQGNEIVDFWQVALNAEAEKDREMTMYNRAENIVLQWNATDHMPLTAKFQLPVVPAQSKIKLKPSLGQEVVCSISDGPKKISAFHGFISAIQFGEPTIIHLEFTRSVQLGALMARIPEKPVPRVVSQYWNGDVYSFQCEQLKQQLPIALQAPEQQEDNMRTVVFQLLTCLGRDPDPLPTVTEEDHGLTVPHKPPMDTVPHKQALRMILVDRRPVVLIEGPPGSGKTTFLMGIIYKILQEEPQQSILVCAPSNKAADNVGLMLYEAQRVDGSPIRVSRHYDPDHPTAHNNLCRPFAPVYLVDQTSEIDTPEIRQLREERESKIQELESLVVPAQQRGNILGQMQTLVDEIKDLKNLLVQRVEEQLKPNVVVTTCFMAMAEGEEESRKFDYVFIDEVGQATQPIVLGAAFQLDQNRGRQVILVGDRHQLPPPVRCDGEAGIRMERSMIAKLEDERVVPLVQLKHTFRMHPSVLEFPATEIYEGRLTTAITCEDRCLLRGKFPFPYLEHPLVFMAVSGRESSAAGRSLMNPQETELVVQVTRYLLDVCGLQMSQIGILSFYDAQRSHILSALISAGVIANETHVSSVDSFQGQERDIIILSCVRSREEAESSERDVVGFLSDYRRVNVAITRARQGLVIIGDPSTLVTNRFWRGLIYHYGDYNMVQPGYSQVLQDHPTTTAVAAGYNQSGWLSCLDLGLYYPVD